MLLLRLCIGLWRLRLCARRDPCGVLLSKRQISIWERELTAGCWLGERNTWARKYGPLTFRRIMLSKSSSVVCSRSLINNIPAHGIKMSIFPKRFTVSETMFSMAGNAACVVFDGEGTV